MDIPAKVYITCASAELKKPCGETAMSVPGCFFSSALGQVM